MTSMLDHLITLDPATPMGRCLAQWERVVEGEHDALAALLTDDAVLHSPVLFRPLPGRDTVMRYLTAAAKTFVGASRESTNATAERADGWNGRFRYVRVVVGTNDAVLEFETTMDGSYVNGVDMIHCNDDGLIDDFKVMVRPARAVDAVKAMMLAALEEG